MRKLSCRYSLLVLLCGLVLLGACGGSATSAEPASSAPSSADAVHEAWVQAVRNGDTDAAVALTDPELSQRDLFARDAVSRMQEYMTIPRSPTGALQDIVVEPVSNNVGRSVWQFAQKRWCYRAELVNRDNHWYISRWGQTSVDCT